MSLIVRLRRAYGLDRTEKVLSSVASVIAIIIGPRQQSHLGVRKRGETISAGSERATGGDVHTDAHHKSPPQHYRTERSTWSGEWFWIQLLLIIGNSLAGALWYACVDYTRHKDKSLLSFIGAINAFFALMLCFYPSLGVLLYEGGHLVWDFVVQGGTVTAGYYLRVGLIALTWASLAVAIMRTSNDL